MLLKKAIQQNKKLFAKFFISLGVCLALVVTCCCLTSAVSAQADDSETVPVEAAAASTGSNAVNSDGTVNGNDTSALYELIGVDASQPIEIIILITLLSVAPSFMIMLTSFTRIIIVLSFLRTAMQTNTTPPNMVLTGLALFLTIFIMWPVFSEINETAYVPYANGEISTTEAIERAGQPLKTFMLKQTTNKNMKFFLDLQDLHLYTDDSIDTENPVEVNVEEITLENYQDQLGFQVVVPAFVISELSRAFQMGFMLFIPFLVIDLVVSSTLMSMGMMMLPPAMISLPFKILLFVLVDGWQMIVGSIVSSFNL
ncbi:MAG: flagellar type III secretion system pore protein FliP [Firmicutes bacterium]|nr:flagellar type III secretion system pore protein FliP [[Eubacterium] siraeum]MCM1486937.1 flagellar type III secretion system pore protein FliP [Bacillota bacterium]